ncbi:pyruvate, water dikinase regulatory protein [Rickettsia endosymbiont of Halotydeus destructor]|uniref:pyruvate, water dikinase regulatory protein n=1 Tax=Rickettsia endosymbiont of Halotydeus destructor TaxID=2996754 RepID=UPI003BB0849A
MTKLIIHLVSDSSVQTAKYAANSALVQFTTIKPKLYHWPMIRNLELLNEVLSKINSKQGMVLYTIADPELRKTLMKFCYELKIPCISVIGKIIKEVSAFSGIEIEKEQSYNYKFDKTYFDTVNAIDYAIRHDDGQMVNELSEADVILIGPSRTSKTPTSVYLAYNGLKTANIPYVYNCPFPDFLEKITEQLVVGLVINPTRLIQIREARMTLLQINENNNYTDFKIVQAECLAVKKICDQKNWPVIDVSTKSIEETSALIMKIYYNQKKTIYKK